MTDKYFTPSGNRIDKSIPYRECPCGDQIMVGGIPLCRKCLRKEDEQARDFIWPETIFAMYDSGWLSVPPKNDHGTQEYVRKDLQQNPSGANGSVVSPSLEGDMPTGNEGKPGHRTEQEGYDICFSKQDERVITITLPDPLDRKSFVLLDYLQTSVRYWQDAYQKEKNKVIELVAAEKKRLSLLNLLDQTNQELAKKEWKE